MFKFGFIQADISRAIRACNSMEHKVKVQQKQFPWMCAVDYQHLVIKNIMTQKYNNQWRSYNQRYLHWKMGTMMRGSSFWQLFGDLVRNIKVFQLGKGYMGGIPAGVKSAGKSWFSTPRNRVGKPKSIAMYARVMEYGLNNHPARSVFQPTASEYAVNGWSLRGLESLYKIGIAWR